DLFAARRSLDGRPEARPLDRRGAPRDREGAGEGSRLAEGAGDQGRALRAQGAGGGESAGEEGGARNRAREPVQGVCGQSAAEAWLCDRGWRGGEVEWGAVITARGRTS